MSRRNVLKYSASVAAAAIWRPIPRSWAVVNEDRPQFSFVQLNDTHVQSPLVAPDPNLETYARANDKLRWCVEEINRAPQPDFVLFIGDLIHGERLDRLALDLGTFQELTKPLVPKIYPTLGNHEVVQQEGDPKHEQPYRQVFGDDRVNYTFEHGEMLFVMLNNSGATVVSPEVIRKRNAWLRDVLEKHPDQKKIIGCHIPIVPVREEAILAKSFGFGSYQCHDKELLELVDAHSQTILAVLSGHLHLTGYVLRNGVHHISIAGTASYPSDFARFAVHEDRIEMTVCQLPPELAKSYPSIHGKPRFATDFTDSHHTTSDEYQIGRTDERRLTIPLSHS